MKLRITFTLCLSAVPCAAVARGQCLDTTVHYSETPDPEDEFGFDVAISGDLMISGAPTDDTVTQQGGSAYVLGRSGEGWAQTTRLTPSDIGFFHNFGAAVDIDAGRAVVGAPGDQRFGPFSGSAYVFELIAGQWFETAKLVPPAGAAFDRFGRSVAIHGDVIVVGALATPSTVGGGAYVYRRQGAGWIYAQALGPSPATGQTDDAFSEALDVHGDVVVIGAWNENTEAFRAGAGYLYEDVGGTFVQTERLIASIPQGARFGESVAAFGDHVAIAAPVELTDTGAVYMYHRSGGSWSLVRRLFHPTMFTIEYLGRNLMLDDDLCLATTVRGTWVHRFDGMTWVDVEELDEPEGGLTLEDFDLDWPTMVRGYPRANGPGGEVRAGSLEIEELGRELGRDVCVAEPSSTGQPARLRADGCRCVVFDRLTLHAENVPVGRFGHFLTGRAQGLVPLAGGSQGLLCIGAPIIRFAGDVLQADAAGTMTFSPSLTAFPQANVVAPGDTWTFQLWFRDVNPGPTSNTTEAVAVTWATSGDPAVQFPDAHEALVEQAVQLAIAVTLSQPAAVDVTVPFTHAGSATELVDYRVDTPSPVVIPAGELVTTILVTVLEDQAQENDESVTFTIGPPLGGVLGTSPAFLLDIADDD